MKLELPMDDTVQVDTEHGKEYGFAPALRSVHQGCGTISVNYYFMDFSAKNYDRSSLISSKDSPVHWAITSAGRLLAFI